MKKKCTKCKIEKELSFFCKNNNSKDGYFYRCKECEKNRKKKFYDETYKEVVKKNYHINKKKIKEYNKKYHNKNKKEILKRNKNWRENNKDKIKQNSNKRYKNDIQHRLKIVLRSRILSALKNKNITKNKKTSELIGCDIPSFKKYLEQLFKIGMSWENFGEWEIDHKIPCCLFDLTDVEHQKVCFNFRNLQPLWWEENAKKNKYINFEININEYVKNFNICNTIL
jgi:hypothetical protein